MNKKIVIGFVYVSLFIIFFVLGRITRPLFTSSNIKVIEPETIDHLYPSEVSTILYLKESNYQIGISSPPERLRPGEEWILQAIMEKGKVLYVKKVGGRVE